MLSNIPVDNFTINDIIKLRKNLKYLLDNSYVETVDEKEIYDAQNSWLRFLYNRNIPFRYHSLILESNGIKDFNSLIWPKNKIRLPDIGKLEELENFF